MQLGISLISLSRRLDAARMSQLPDLISRRWLPGWLRFTSGQKMVVKAEKPDNKRFQQVVDLEAC